MIRYSAQTINNKDISSIKKVLKSNNLTQGPKVPEFEKRITKYTKSKFCLAFNSASSALLAACSALKLKKKDFIWTSPNTYVATANAIVLNNYKIDFVDINLDTYNICLDLLEKKLVQAKKKKILPKAIIFVYIGGLPLDPIRLKKLSKKFKFKIIEDASHAIGSEYFGKKVGSCFWSDISIFSFHPVKIITTGEGGCITTNDKEYFEHMKLFRENGIQKNPRKFRYKSPGPWYYEQQKIGYNFRMNDIQAALGISQLKRIKNFIQKRNKVASIYKKNLEGLPLTFQKINKKLYSSYHLFILRLNKEQKKIYKELFLFLRKKNIFVNLHYLPVHLHPYYKNLGFAKNQFINSELYSSTSLSIPIYPNLSLKDQMKVIKLIKSFFKKKI